MRLFPLFLAMVIILAIPVSAVEFTAPEVPESGRDLMPEKPDSFGEGLLEILQDAVKRIRPDLAEAAKTCLSVMASVLLVSVLQSFSGKTKSICDLVGAVSVAGLLLQSTNSLIHIGSRTVTQMSEYGKLLLPVMTGAMAAEGGLTASTALYIGTAVFDSVLSSVISNLLIPLIYAYIGLSAANSAVGEEILKKLRDFVKWIVSWCLKTILYIFTGYMGITGVVSGTTDAAVLKATKMTISGMVPVVGGILADASDSVLVGAGLVKNAAGIYGILALIAVFLGPFLQIGVHYLLLKATGAVCGVFGSKRITDLVLDFSTAMGLLLAMTGAVCLLMLISTVCFLKEVG